MKIGGLNNFSLSDYPDHIASLIFTQGCNFRCPWCHNGQLIPTDAPEGSLISECEVFQFLEERKKQLNGIVISGGEPTIQPGLCTFLHRIKAMGYAVKLDTNGSKPETIKTLLENDLLDYIAMDIKAPWHKYDRLSGVNVQISQVKQSISTIAKSGIEHEFRTTVVESLLTPDNIETIRAIVPDGSKYRLQRFCPELSLEPPLRNYSNQIPEENRL